MKVKRNNSIFVRLLVVAVSVYLVVSLITLWRQLDTSQKKLDALKVKRATTNAEIEEYRALLNDESQRLIIEKAARERFGYAYPYEEIYKEIK